MERARRVKITAVEGSRPGLLRFVGCVVYVFCYVQLHFAYVIGFCLPSSPLHFVVLRQCEQLQLQRAMDRVCQGDAPLPSRAASSPTTAPPPPPHLPPPTTTTTIVPGLLFPRLSFTCRATMASRGISQARRTGSAASGGGACACHRQLTLRCRRGGGLWALDEDFSRGHPMMMVCTPSIEYDDQCF